MQLSVKLDQDQNESWCRKVFSISILFSILALPSTIGCRQISDPGSRVVRNVQVIFPHGSVNRSNSLLSTRSLLHSTAEYGEDPTDRPCSNEDIIIIQGASSPLPSGIPTYTVEIMNACLSGCSICNIHVRCGWFSSARLIDPNVFRRLCYDDCLVNDGNPLAAGETLSFQYANSFQYPLSVSSLVCC
ncbi:hypothetical protein RND81_10G001100 [Saponaria officinalis]|uniref:Uncharacterized protein n=1 Tax=Saponaria officinalis TaxID=3572 RepID=A0AAW1HZ20_SAPOF